MTDANGLIITVRLPTECFLALNSTYLNSDLPFPIVSLWANCPISLGVRVKWKKKKQLPCRAGRTKWDAVYQGSPAPQPATPRVTSVREGILGYSNAQWRVSVVTTKSSRKYCEDREGFDTIFKVLLKELKWKDISPRGGASRILKNSPRENACFPPCDWVPAAWNKHLQNVWTEVPEPARKLVESSFFITVFKPK